MQDRFYYYFSLLFYQAEMSVHSSLEHWVDKVYLLIINIATCQHRKAPHKKTHYSDVTEST